MMRRRFALLLLFTLIAGMVSATESATRGAWAHDDAPGHADGSSCPDPEDGGHPCGPACACLCCPGHTGTTIVVPRSLALDPPAAAEPSLGVGDELDPKDVCFRIFHPPRA